MRFKYFVIIFLNLFGFSAIGQGYYKGINGEKLLKVDSLSYKKENLYSGFFVDSITKTPYTGIMIIRYVIDGIPSDSICLKNGLIQGYRKLYKTSYKKNTSVLYGFGYTDQNTKVEIYLGIKKNQKNNGKIIATPYEYFIRFKKEKVKLIKSQKSKVMTKLTFTNLEDFQIFIQAENENFFEKCKEMGFFGEKTVIPVLNGSCDD